MEKLNITLLDLENRIKSKFIAMSRTIKLQLEDELGDLNFDLLIYCRTHRKFDNLNKAIDNTAKLLNSYITIPSNFYIWVVTMVTILSIIIGCSPVVVILVRKYLSTKNADTNIPEQENV